MWDWWHQMSWQKASYIAVVAQTVIFALSALFILLQLWKQTKLAKAANAQALVEMFSPFRVLLIQDPQLTKLYLDGQERYDEFDDVDKYRFRRLAYWALTFNENLYYQRRNKLLDAKLYSGWEVGMRELATHIPETVWLEMQDKYHEDFRNFIERLRHEGAKQPPLDKT
jgi:hypothetical protein